MFSTIKTIDLKYLMIFIFAEYKMNYNRMKTKLRMKLQENLVISLR